MLHVKVLQIVLTCECCGFRGAVPLPESFFPGNAETCRCVRCRAPHRVSYFEQGETSPETGQKGYSATVMVSLEPGWERPTS